MKPIPPELVHDITALLDEPVEPSNDVRVQELRRHMRRAYAPWTDHEGHLLLALSEAGWTVSELSELLWRQPGAIQSRLSKLLEPPAPREPRARRPEVTRIPAHLAAAHFPAWLDLVKVGGVVQITEGSEVVAELRAPDMAAPDLSRRAGRRWGRAAREQT